MHVYIIRHWAIGVNFVLAFIVATCRFLVMDRSISYALEIIACSSVVLKSEQASCVKSICAGKDVFLWLPTGFGKSLCYEVLPFIFDDKLGKYGPSVKSPT